MKARMSARLVNSWRQSLGNLARRRRSERKDHLERSEGDGVELETAELDVKTLVLECRELCN